eukprot:scaffold4215_cov202-Alexandrium_tamarense.AAC.2
MPLHSSGGMSIGSEFNEFNPPIPHCYTPQYLLFWVAFKSESCKMASSWVEYGIRMGREVVG